MLVDGQWIPTFPKARYLMGKKEYEYWDTADADTLNSGVMGDSVRPVFDAGLVDLVAMDHRVCDEIYFEPTPGHTPGHISVHIESEGEHALITGDCIHHPCQIDLIEWARSAEYDPTEAQVTRRK